MDKQTTIDRNIIINKNHITEFPLTSSEGTKRMKEKFHIQAIKDRNQYTAKEKEQFLFYQNEVYFHIKNRMEKIFPHDKTSSYEKDRKEFQLLERTLKLINPHLDDAFKLDFYFLIGAIDDGKEDSLQEIHSILIEFMKKCEDASISLTLNDFSYSMYTLKYMNTFLEHKDSTDFFEVMKKTFESIYWECPEVIQHLKLNLLFILNQYQKQFSLYLTQITNDLLHKVEFSSNVVIDQYIKKRSLLEEEIARDEYYNLNVFLEKKRNILDYLENASARTNNFNHFTLNGNFSSLTPEEKSKYRHEILSLNATLTELKDYYRYEFIIQDMISLYKKKDENKNTYDLKLKEIKIEEARRGNILKEFNKASGKSFLHRPNKDKIRIAKLKMNKQVSKLNQMYQELHDLEILVKIQNQLTDTSSLDDLFLTSFSSYYYLEKKFIEHFKDRDHFSLEDEIHSYFQFIYSPDNTFLRKINGFVTYDVSAIISDKYRLLGLNITKEELVFDNLDTTREILSFVAFVYFVSSGKLSLEEMYFIFRFHNFLPVSKLEKKSIELL